MNASTPPAAGPQRRGADSRTPGAAQPAATAATPRMPARYVDPYDMRADPQQEEPGYGHGV